MNALNYTNFKKLFADVELQPSTAILENFDNRLARLMGMFKCFIRWKGNVYRIKEFVMSIDNPNVLCRETIFIMGILKPCLVAKKLPEEEQKQISVIPAEIPRNALEAPGGTIPD